MATIVGGIGTSHVPIIGKTIAANRQTEVEFAPFFAAYHDVHAWLDEVRPDVAVVVYNDHGLNFFLDKMPTFAVGAAADYRNADEGWGPPEPRSVRGAPDLSWHLIDSLVTDEFDVTMCQEMLFDHAGITALDLAWPGHDLPVAVIPVVLNAVRSPLPTPARCYKFGQAIGRAIASYPENLKVVVIGSGGLSHQLGEMGSINAPFDQECMEKIVADPVALTAYSNADYVRLAGTQGLEIMTWLTMRGAVAGDVSVAASVYHVPISHTGGAMMLLDARRQTEAV